MPAARYQARSVRSPCSVSAVTTRRVHTRPSAASPATSSSARCLATNTSGSSSTTGSSKVCSTRRSGGGSAPPAGRSSRPAARRWAWRPAGPKRASTSPSGSAARSPRRARPRRANSPTSSGSTSPTTCSQATGSGARNAGVPPGATTIAAPAGPPGGDGRGEAPVGDARPRRRSADGAGLAAHRGDELLGERARRRRSSATGRGRRGTASPVRRPRGAGRSGRPPARRVRTPGRRGRDRGRAARRPGSTAGPGGDADRS